MYENEDSREKIYFVYLKALARGILLSVGLLLIAALIFFYTTLNEKYMDNIVWIITILGMCYGSIFGAHRIGTKGIIHGSAIGLIYIAVLGAMALLIQNGDFDMMSYIIMTIMALIVGGLSGMIGVVLAKN